MTDEAQDKVTSHNIIVAYGPDLVDLNNSAPLNVDITTPYLKTVNLTCIVNGVYPAVAFTWTGACRDVTTDICTFLLDVDKIGNISCTASNTITGQRVASRSRQVTVSSRPVVMLTPAGQLKVSRINGEVHLTFALVTAPQPDAFSIQPLVPQKDTSLTFINVSVFATCSSNGTSYIVLCELRVDNVTSQKEGNYLMNVYNAVGTTAAMFHISKEKTEKNIIDSGSGSTPSSIGGTGDVAAAVGVTVAVMVVIFTVIICVFTLILWRRQWLLPCGAVKDSLNKHDRVESKENKTESAEHIYELEDTTQPRVSEPRRVQTDTAAPTYSSLRTSEIGLPSVYTEYKPGYLSVS